jgi:signal transduction histidine kinase
MNPPAEQTPASVLIVDDDEVLRAVMRAALEQSGFAVDEAEDGEDAVARCSARLPDVVIADVMMPRMDGFALCRELRHQSATTHVPILVATSLDDVPSIEMAYDCGATDFISKPISWPILTHRIRYMLRAARAFRELRANQSDLIAAKEAAEAASRSKSQFLANMSHELRTPLNAIIGFSTLMRDETLGAMPKQYAEYPAMVVESGEHLLAIINSVLEISRAETNQIALDRGEIDIEATVRFSIRQVRDMARRSQVDCTAELAPDLPTLYADAAKLRQILINLLSNAIKFTPARGRVSLTVSADALGGIAFVVQDTGIGIRPEHLDLALTPFGQVDARLSRSHDGVGLGLPLSKRLVELHGGTFEIASTPGEGTTVTVRLPGTGFTEIEFHA